MTNNDEALKQLAIKNDENRKKVSSPVRVDRQDVVKPLTAYQTYMKEINDAK